MVRVRVHHPDGVFRGGFLTIEHFPRHEYRTWEAPSRADFTEVLIFTEDDLWYLLQISKHPDFDRPEDDVDAVDGASRAYRYSDADARAWFERQKLPPPADLVERLGGAEEAPAGAAPASMDERIAAAILDDDPTPLTRQECAVLELLLELPPKKGLLGRDICDRLSRTQYRLDESGLTKRVIPVLKRRCGVQNVRRRGYFLPPRDGQTSQRA